MQDDVEDKKPISSIEQDEEVSEDDQMEADLIFSSDNTRAYPVTQVLKLACTELANTL